MRVPDKPAMKTYYCELVLDGTSKRKVHLRLPIGSKPFLFILLRRALPTSTNRF